MYKQATSLSKGQRHEIFSWIIFPKTLKITVRSFQFFSEIRKSGCTTGINDNSGKFVTRINDTGGNFATGTAGVVDTGGKFSISVNDTVGKSTGGKLAQGNPWCCWYPVANLPPVSTIPAAHLPPVSTTKCLRSGVNETRQ